MAALPQVPILKGKNYEIWSKKMESILRQAGVWNAVENSEVDDSKNTTAHCFILNGLDDGLDDSVLGKISETKSPKEAWKILKDKYTNESRINDNAAPLFVAISAGFVLRLLFGDVPSDAGMQSFVLIEVFAMVLLIYVIYNVAGLKITNAQFRAMAIGAVIGMIVAISGSPLLGASMNPARTTGAVAGSSISIYMILGAVLGSIYYDVITPPSVANVTTPAPVANVTTPAPVAKVTKSTK